MNESVWQLCLKYIETVYGDSFFSEHQRMAFSMYEDVMSGKLPRTVLQEEVEILKNSEYL